MSQLHNKQTNELDYYQVIDMQTNTIYETFRTINAAKRYLHEHPLKDELKIIINPKYVVTE